jgi:hypothetical protein
MNLQEVPHQKKDLDGRNQLLDEDKFHFADKKSRVMDYVK